MAEQGRHAEDIVAGLTRDLNRIMWDGWRGASADAALTALPPINQWSATVADTAERTITLMDASGSAAGQAKAAVPSPKSFDWGEALQSFSLGGGIGAFTDAVAQEQQKLDAHAEAVRIMTNVYSAPINDHRAAVPTYPQLVDPTLQAPDQPPNVGPAPGALYSGAGGPGAGVGGHGGGHIAHPPPAAATALQGVASGASGVPVPHGTGQVAPGQVARGPWPGDGQVGAAAAASVPITAPVAGGDIRQAGVAGGGIRPGGSVRPGVGRTGGGYPGGGVHSSGSGRADTGHGVEFGPRPTGVAVETAEGQVGGLGRGAGVAGAGRAGAGEMMAPIGGARGKCGEDSEHRRPSYLIEMDDIFTDGRKVAPAVIGEDPPH